MQQAMRVAASARHVAVTRYSENRVFVCDAAVTALHPLRTAWANVSCMTLSVSSPTAVSLVALTEASFMAVATLDGIALFR